MKFGEAVVKILERKASRMRSASGRPHHQHLQYLGESKAIRHYTVRHEEAAAHAAGAYFRASGRMAACLTTSGPGATNLVTGLYSCQIDSIPLVAITGRP
jgi:tartronate-semialdehyde synthase